MAVTFSREEYEHGGAGNKKLHVRLSTVLHLRDLVGSGDLDQATTLLDLILDYEEREKIRAMRNEVYHRKEHAREVGDMKSYNLYDGLLKDCTEAAKALSI